MRYYPALTFWSIVGIITLSMLLYYLGDQVFMLVETFPFNQQITRYLRSSATIEGKEEAFSENMERIDRILPVNLGTQSVDDLFFELPDRMKPKKPSDVRFVAFLDWSSIPYKPYYDSSGKSTAILASQSVCHIRVVDIQKGKLLARKTIEGDLPPDRIRSHQSGDGPRPTEAVVNYLEKLIDP